MFTPPAYLSPSSINTYRECPQKFKFSRIDGLKEPPTWHTHLGTFVHEVLEHFYQIDAADRSLDSARTLATERWREGAWEDQVKALLKPVGSITEFKQAAFECISNLWKVEDPQQTEIDGMEHEVLADVDGVAMKGYIDRFIFDTDGKVVIGDYKTGNPPNPRFKSEDEKFFQLLAYALMLEAADQEETSRVQLLYLKMGTTHEVTVTPVKLAIARGVIVETKEAIDDACAKGSFECNVTKLCDWCHFKPICPAHS